MNVPQSGILALGTPAHAYLEFDAVEGIDRVELVAAAASFAGAQTTGTGANVVVGFRPELWRHVMPDDAPEDVTGYVRAVAGVEGFSMPATQHDAFVWIASGAYDAVFDLSSSAIAALANAASLADETVGWPYRHNRDLTGFIDGSENPPLIEAASAALIPDGQPGAGGSVLLLQKWIHETAKWVSLSDAEQAKVIGRNKSDSVELEDKPEDSHVARTDQDTFGHIVRRNMPFGDASMHGTMFVGFCATQRPLAAMLDSMAGRANGVRDALTRFSRPMTGAYYFVPALTSLRRFG
ncbi:MAG TPA: Dyp-type peroxidase [Casimicrobiaceae bacterium]|nr:Dyp-type peroxidase [Casimicrobiaceae bacterium]